MNRHFLTAILFLFAAIPVSGRGILVSPSQLGLISERGTKATDVIYVSSSRAEKNFIQVTLTDFTRNERGEVTEVAAANAPRSCRSWIEVDQTNFVSPESGRVELRVTANVPKDAEGSYWALVSLRILPPPPQPGEQQQDRGMGFRIVPRIAIPVIVTVAGTEKREVRIASLDVAGGDAETVEVETMLENRGNTAVLVNGAMTLDSVAPGSGDVTEIAETSFAAVTSLPGTKVRVKGRLGWKGAVEGLQLHSIVRYGPDRTDVAESSVAIDATMAKRRSNTLAPAPSAPQYPPSEGTPVRETIEKERLAPPAPARQPSR